MKFTAKTDIKDFTFSASPELPVISGYKVKESYDCVFNINANSTIQELTLLFTLDEYFGLNPQKNYVVAHYDEFSENVWEVLPIDLSLKNSNQIGLSSSEESLIGEIFHLSADTDHYFTIFEIEQEPDLITWFLNNLAWFIIVIMVTIGLVFLYTKKQYLAKIRSRIVPLTKGKHQLSLEEVLENENQDKIIEIILKEPGIHFSELQRKTNLAGGNLVWHLDVLESYKIIGKKRVGNFVAYFPYYYKNPISNIDLKLSKSEVTLQILNEIENEPGIWNNKISNKLNLDHSTVKYHIDKLLALKLIQIKKSGRKNKIYPNLDAEYFNERFPAA